MGTIRIRIYGIVQGVFFRASAQQIASGLGLTGWVRNMPDGSLEIVAQGTPAKLEAFLKWCHKGPEGARIDRVEVAEEKNAPPYEPFDIVHGKGGDPYSI